MKKVTEQTRDGKQNRQTFVCSPQKTVYVPPETMTRLTALKKATGMPRTALLEAAINLMVAHFKRAGTLEPRLV
jgi:hypothetical protein